jgi:hypothetical protein
MNWFHKLHTHRYPPGLERRIWRKLPLAMLASIVIPAGLSIGTRLSPPDGSSYEVAKATSTVDIFAIALLLTAVTAVITVGIGCIVVMIMKGPAYVADGDRPVTRVPLAPDDD